MNMRKWIGRNIWIWSALGALALLIIISIISHSSVIDMLLSNAILASFLVLLCLGQMTVITSGDGAIDLSIQYTIPLAAYVSSILIGIMGIALGGILTLCICAGVGLMNGLINKYLRVPAIITTLAVGYIVYSAVLVISTTTTGVPLQSISYFTQKLRIAGISPLVIIAVAGSLLMGLLLYKTKYGRELHATGQNRVAARLAGINVTVVVIIAFIISSVIAGFTGILLGGYFGGAFQDMGISYFLTSIAAPVIGGTSVAGGKSSVAGCFSGAMMLTLLVTFLNVTKLPASGQDLVQGVLLIIILIASVPKKQMQNV